MMTNPAQIFVAQARKKCVKWSKNNVASRLAPEYVQKKGFDVNKMEIYPT